MIIDKEAAKSQLLKHRIILDNGCWKFNGWHNNKNRGMLRIEKRLWLVSRLAILLFKPEEYKEFLQANHNCKDESCFNPDHLYMGTQSQNLSDAGQLGNMSRTFNHANSQKDKCPSGHLYDKENTKIRKNGSRECKKCRKLHNALRYLKF